MYKKVHIPDRLTDILDDLIEIAAWWRERKQLTQISSDPERETERKTYHIEKRHADLERVSITEIVNRAFWHYFEGKQTSAHTAIPAHSLATPSFHVNSMICEGVDHPFCLDASGMVITRGVVAG